MAIRTLTLIRFRSPLLIPPYRLISELADLGGLVQVGERGRCIWQPRRQHIAEIRHKPESDQSGRYGESSPMPPLDVYFWASCYGRHVRFPLCPQLCPDEPIE